ncbi:hypothetical protein B0H19DRAFT_1262355 [Mycena capillaripes]|nr:hypothetical protein B0H19DRAFT_1262355 [Mycena capillaripes]
MFCNGNASRLASLYPGRTIAPKVLNTNRDETVWGQMLYVGSLDQWMIQELDENKYKEEVDEESVFHILSFLLTPDFTGDPYFLLTNHSADHHAALFAPQAVRAFHAIASPLERHPKLQYPNLWPETRTKSSTERHSKASDGVAPPWPCNNSPDYNPQAPPSSLHDYFPAPPWPHYTEPRLHTLPPSRVSSPLPSLLQPVSETSPQRPVFRVPTPQELEAMKVMSELRALEVNIDIEQKIAAVPDSPHPRVFVPPTSDNTVPSDSPPASPLPPSRAPSPFRIIPSLPARFPLLFGPYADAEAEDADVSDGTFSDIESTTDVEDDEADESDCSESNEPASEEESAVVEDGKGDEQNSDMVMSDTNEDDGEEADDEDDKSR